MSRIGSSPTVQGIPPKAFPASQRTSRAGQGGLRKAGRTQSSSYNHLHVIACNNCWYLTEGLYASFHYVLRKAQLLFLPVLPVRALPTAAALELLRPFEFHSLRSNNVRLTIRLGSLCDLPPRQHDNLDRFMLCYVPTCSLANVPQGKDRGAPSPPLPNTNPRTPLPQCQITKT